jgi:diketogulonate reductase-like aldo/keto reductase
LLEYCRKEGIVLQAYSSLGGQDTGKKAWKKILGTKAVNNTPTTTTASEGTKRKKKKEKEGKHDLLHAQPVLELADELCATPAQVLLRWGLERGAALIPKTTSKDRMVENSGVFDITMTQDQADGLQSQLLEMVRRNNPDIQQPADAEQLTRLCWRSDPLRHLDFE